MSPIDVSPLAEMVPTWAISSLVDTFLDRACRSFTAASTARSTPRLRSIGFMPAATDLAPSRTIAWASTVAVVVPSPATSLVLEATSRTIWAPMFSNLSGSAEGLLDHDVAALRTERDLHGVGEDVHAAQHLLAGVCGEFHVFGSHRLYASCSGFRLGMMGLRGL